jgi:hypothetical protein
MAKKTGDDRPKQTGSDSGEPTPPPFLSEKLIAQLQGAVDAAQRKRMPHPSVKGENTSAGKDF